MGVRTPPPPPLYTLYYWVNNATIYYYSKGHLPACFLNVAVNVNIYPNFPFIFVFQTFYGFVKPPIRYDRRAGKPRTQHNATLCQACRDGECDSRPRAQGPQGPQGPKVVQYTTVTAAPTHPPAPPTLVTTIAAPPPPTSIRKVVFRT